MAADLSLSSTPVDGRPSLPAPPAAARVTVPRSWWSWGGAHGGLLMALTAEVVERVTPGQPLRALTTHFLAPVGEQPVELFPLVERVTAGSATTVVRAVQESTLVALSVAASLRPRVSWEVPHVRPAPAVPAPEDRPAFRDAEALFPFARQLEIRPTDDVVPLSGAAVPVLTAWVRLRSGGSVGLSEALVLLDSLAPAAYASWTAPAVTPTVQLSAHLMRDLTRESATGWVLAQHRHSATRDGASVDECSIWSQDGDLLAEGRQLRRVLTGGEPTSPKGSR